LLLGWDETGTLTWAVDASFAVHGDFRSHTGALLTFGKGAAMAFSMKQKINSKSSTEAELIGVDDALNFLVWVKQWMEWQMQEYPESERTKILGRKNVILQDNTSAIQLERFGKRSSTKCTRHLSIRYFYCKSLMDDKVINAVTYCPPKELVADYLSKPLQGSLFRTHRNSILGITDADEAFYAESYKNETGTK
jgi:hypothetical protein